MARRITALLLICLLFTAAALAQNLTLKQIKSYKKQITALQKDINRLNRKLKKTKAKQLKADIKDKIKNEQAKIVKIKNILYPKPKKIVKKPVFVPPPAVEISSLESAPEEAVSLEAAPKKRLIGFNYDLGAQGGIFAGTSGFFASVRAPLGLVVGPAVTAARLSGGLTQTLSSDRRYVPVCLDLIFNFPPGWFSGVENYLGAGLNYTVRTTGGTGTVGGELFYGVQSEGFNGIVFGELGFSFLRSGFTSSDRGLIVMVGFREPFAF